ncbi:MAG: hypothetical protein LH618_20060, partial [Saprospiraceae bacterium]|nr:hypothetical protein [Saprospiraceae bacterium]
MKSLLRPLFFLFIPLFLFSQQRPTPIYVAPDAPAWMQMIQTDTPNVLTVQAAYRDYYATHPFQKNAYTQYYKRWMHWARPSTQADGVLHLPTVQELAEKENVALAARHIPPITGGAGGGLPITGGKGEAFTIRGRQGGPWTMKGTIPTCDTDGT